MFTIDSNTKPCGFSDQLVEYLYDEMDRSKIHSFKRHLSSCAVCSSEAESFAFVRGSIGDWKSESIDRFVPPRVDLVAIPPTRPKSIFDQLATIFRPAYAVPVAALLLIGMAVGTLYFRSGGSTASVAALTLSDDAPAASTREPVQQLGVKPLSQDSTRIALKENDLKGRDSIVENSRIGRTAKAKLTTQRPRLYARREVRKSLPADSLVVADKNPTGLDLGTADESQDQTLRLADLYAEIDAS